MNICIYGSASNDIDRVYIEKTEEIARTLAKRGHSLVFGGGANGLMGAAARGFYAEKAENTVWYQAVLDSMITNEAGSFENSILEEYEAKTVENEEAVSKVIAYVANMASSQYGY